MPNPYGNNPTITVIKHYLIDTRHSYAQSTQAVRTRNMIYMAGVFEALNILKMPDQFTKEDILTFMDWLAQQDIGNGRKLKLMGYLNSYLSYFDNGVISAMQKNKQIKMPRVVAPVLRSMTEERVQFIHQCTLNMTGWDGALARFLTMAYPYTGLRPSELRTLKYKDLDQSDMAITVSHPKGEGLYGQHRVVWILPQAIPSFKEFLQERAEYLREHGESVNFEALIPHKGHRGITYWTDAELRKFKKKIEDVAGVKFHIKDYRATYCQMCIDKGAELGQELTTAVSRTMGHKDTKTTETFYGRIRNVDANRKLREAFMEPNVIAVRP